MVDSLPARSLGAVWRMLFGALAVAAAVDVLHPVLDAVYAPFAGPVDDAFHVVLGLGPWVYMVGLPVAAVRLVVRLSHGGPPSRWAAPLLVVIVVVQSIALVVTPVVVRSSTYQAMYPPLVGGLVMAGLTVWAARPLIGRILPSIPVALCALAWTWGHLTADVLMATEGFVRGRGPLWGSAATNLLIAATNWAALLGLPRELLGRSFDRSSGLAGLLCLGIPAALAWALLVRRELRQHPLAAAAVAASIVLLSVRLAGWSSFILD